MNRTSVLVALMVVAGMLAVPAASVVAQETDAEDDGDGGDVKPGERLSGVVGVQSAEIDGEIEGNAYAIALERADDNATKASRMAEKLNETERRLNELDERKTRLQEQRESGEMTEGQYQARMARVATEIETARQQLNRTNATAAELPPDTLADNGVNRTAIRTLMHNANEMSGGEVAEIARSIGGDRRGMVDRGPERGGAEDRGDAHNRTDSGPDGDRTAEQPGDDSPDVNQTASDDAQQNDGGTNEMDGSTGTEADGETDDEPVDSSEPQSGDGGSGAGNGGAGAKSA
jgi:hypothetical protein